MGPSRRKLKPRSAVSICKTRVRRRVCNKRCNGGSAPAWRTCRGRRARRRRKRAAALRQRAQRRTHGSCGAQTATQRPAARRRCSAAAPARAPWGPGRCPRTCAAPAATATQHRHQQPRGGFAHVPAKALNGVRCHAPGARSAWRWRGRQRRASHQRSTARASRRGASDAAVTCPRQHERRARRQYLKTHVHGSALEEGENLRQQDGHVRHGWRGCCCGCMMACAQRSCGGAAQAARRSSTTAPARSGRRVRERQHGLHGSARAHALSLQRSSRAAQPAAAVAYAACRLGEVFAAGKPFGGRRVAEARPATRRRRGAPHKASASGRRWWCERSHGGEWQLQRRCVARYPPRSL